MAKFEQRLSGSFSSFLRLLEEEILSGSVSASVEDESDFRLGDTRCAVRVFERYSYFGGNRVSLNITLFGTETDFTLSAITSGGSQAVFFKLNTVGEESFLECVEKIVKAYRRDN